MSFQAPEGGIAAQILNSNLDDVSVNLVYHGHTLHLISPGHSIGTALW